MEGNLRLKIDWARLIVGRKFTFLLCFTLYLRAIAEYKPPGGLYLEGRFNGGSYFRNFTVIGIPECGKFLLVESGILEIQINESGILFKVRIRNPSSIDKESRIQDCLGEICSC